VADAAASAFGGTDRQSSTRGSKRGNAHERPADIRVVRPVDRRVLGSESTQALPAADPLLRGRDSVQVIPPRLTPGQEREEAMRRLARCPAAGLDAAEHAEGMRVWASAYAERKAKLTEAGR
jgi:hypothetical protein